VLQRLSIHIRDCLDRAKGADAKAAVATTAEVKADYEDMACHWRTLARSFQFCESLERFLVDADKRRATTQPELPKP
jgi:hypothetical protein